MLKSRNTRGINHVLREIIININHCKDGAGIQGAMLGSLQPLTIQLLAVCESARRIKAFTMPWQNLFKAGMTLSKHAFVK